MQMCVPVWENACACWFIFLTSNAHTYNCVPFWWHINQQITRDREGEERGGWVGGQGEGREDNNQTDIHEYMQLKHLIRLDKDTPLGQVTQQRSSKLQGHRTIWLMVLQKFMDVISDIWMQIYAAGTYQLSMTAQGEVTLPPQPKFTKKARGILVWGLQVYSILVIYKDNGLTSDSTST